MKLVIQRVTRGSVSVANKTVGQINAGYVVLVGFRKGDSQQNLIRMAQKLINIRIMPDRQDKMNLSIQDIKGEILLVPQFTLYADTTSRRPGFTQSEQPKRAKKLFDLFVAEVAKSGLNVKAGQFGAYMQVEITNDGPVTIILEN